MTLEEFSASYRWPNRRGGMPAPLAALWWDAKGDWARAHSMVDDLETPDAMAVHAYLHRKEGVGWNADYWYKRAGHKFRRPTLDAESGGAGGKGWLGDRSGRVHGDYSRSCRSASPGRYRVNADLVAACARTFQCRCLLCDIWQKTDGKELDLEDFGRHWESLVRLRRARGGADGRRGCCIEDLSRRVDSGAIAASASR